MEEQTEKDAFDKTPERKKLSKVFVLLVSCSFVHSIIAHLDCSETILELFTCAQIEKIRKSQFLNFSKESFHAFTSS